MCRPGVRSWIENAFLNDIASLNQGKLFSVKCRGLSANDLYLICVALPVSKDGTVFLRAFACSDPNAEPVISSFDFASARSFTPEHFLQIEHMIIKVSSKVSRDMDRIRAVFPESKWIQLYR